ncbi:WG repeat-containing protein [Flavobacteriaceae bacterium 3-367]
MRKLRTVLAIILVFPFFLNAQTVEGIDEIAPFSEGLAAVRKGSQWGFIDTAGKLVIDFRSDLVWDKDTETATARIKGIPYPSFKDGRCLVMKMEDEIPLYGFIDTKGKLAIEHQFLNVAPFNEGYTTGVVFDRVFRGNNEFKLKIYDYKFHDVLMDTSGEIVEFFDRRYNIQLTKRRYELPSINAKMLSKDLVALKGKGEGWDIRKLEL